MKEKNEKLQSDENKNNDFPSVNSVISNLSHLRPNKITYQLMNTNKPKYRQKKNTNPPENSKPAQNGQSPSKLAIEKIRFHQLAYTIDEKPEMSSNPQKNDDKNEKPKKQNIYKNRAVKTITYKNKNINVSYYPNGQVDPDLRHSSSYSISQDNSFNKITKSLSPPNKNKVNNINNENVNNSYNDKKKDKNNSKYQYNFTNIIPENPTLTRYSLQVPSHPPQKIYNFKNILKLNPFQKAQTSRDSSRSKRKALSPGTISFQRKTINRGEPIKNVQITHVIESTNPCKFHIKESLSTESLKKEPIRISQTERLRLKKRGKSSFTTSVQDNIKPAVVNLKGITTIYQHARGIGMTNDKNPNLNPLFYSSQIKKLYPRIKKKMKEKVEYMTFRNETGRNTTYRSSMSHLNINNRYNHLNDINDYKPNLSKLNNNNNNYNNYMNSNSYPVRNSVEFNRNLNNYNINNDWNNNNYNINYDYSMNNEYITNGYNKNNDYTMDNDYNINYSNKKEIMEQNGIFSDISNRCGNCGMDDNRDSVGYNRDSMEYINKVYIPNYYY